MREGLQARTILEGRRGTDVDPTFPVGHEVEVGPVVAIGSSDRMTGDGLLEAWAAPEPDSLAEPDSREASEGKALGIEQSVTIGTRCNQDLIGSNRGSGFESDSFGFDSPDPVIQPLDADGIDAVVEEAKQFHGVDPTFFFDQKTSLRDVGPKKPQFLDVDPARHRTESFDRIQDRIEPRVMLVSDHRDAAGDVGHEG